MAKYAGLSRRRFLAGAVGAGGLGALIACGSQVSQMQNAPYATNAARNAGSGTVLAAAQPSVATPAASGTAMTGMSNLLGLTTTPASTSAATSAATQAPHTPVDASLPALLPLVPGTTNVRTLSLVTSDQTIAIADGVRMAAWTFGGTVPGPVVHVKQGDTVKFTLTNQGTMPHSIDFHAAQVPPNIDYADIKPGESKPFDWTAEYPGVFMYHCGSPLVIAHISSGMYGAVVVDPATPLPAAREYVLVQSEFYVTGKEGDVQTVDVSKALNKQPDYVAFNGYASQYASAPLTAKVGERVRLYIVNAGPNDFSAFHVIGTIFENTYADGNPANVQHGNQTVTIPPGGGYMVEFTIPTPGTYPFVTHSFADATHGAAGAIQITP
jgi:nitrite reductase (NO-forming)